MTDRHTSLQIHGTSPGPRRAARRQRVVRRAFVGLAILLVALALLSVRALHARNGQARALDQTVSELARQPVNVVKAQSTQGAPTLLLPGTLQGKIESPIYARATGYLIRWHTDIGAQVRQGDVLAELDTPEIDQQLLQARAAREQAAASLELARTSSSRWEALRRRDAVSQQELDERQSALSQARANLGSAEANVRRLQQQQSFKRVVAPFAGTITRRNVDVGDLIDAGAGSRPLFQLARTDVLRTSIQVPQTFAQRVTVGQTVSLRQAELPGQRFEGRVTQSAGAIDMATRTMQLIVELPNPERRLMPGAFVEVEFRGVETSHLVVPANTLLFRADGPMVARVIDDTARLQRVVLGRNFGRTIEILEGIAPEDRMVLNPSDSLAEGDLLRIIDAAADTRQK